MPKIEIDLHTASLIRRVFLPTNPARMRNAAPITLRAAVDFIAAVEKAEQEQREFEATRDHSPF